MFNLIFTCLACAGLAFGAQNIDKVEYHQNENVIFHQELKRNATYNDETYTITLTADELNNYTWNNLSGYLSTLSGGQVSEEEFGFQLANNNYGNQSLDYYYYSDTNYFLRLLTNLKHEVDGDEFAYYMIIGNSTYYPSNNKFILYDIDNSELGPEFEYDLSFVATSTYYNGFKTAIQADITANQPANDNYAGALGDFVSIMVAGISDLATGIAGGVVEMTKDLFLVVDGTTGSVTGLSIFGGVVALFAGLVLAVGITKRVYLWVTSLGK